MFVLYRLALIYENLQILFNILLSVLLFSACFFLLKKVFDGLSKKNKKITYISIGIISYMFVLYRLALIYENLQMLFTLFLVILVVSAFFFLLRKVLDEFSKCPRCGTPNSSELVDQQWHGTFEMGTQRETRNIYKNTYRCSKCGHQYWKTERSWFN